MSESPTSSEVVSGKDSEKALDSCGARVCFVIVQILIWATIAAIIYCAIYLDQKSKLSFVIGLGVFFLFLDFYYIFGNFSSLEWKCLNNVKTPSQTTQLMQDLFRNQLKINLITESWHYHTRYRNGRSSTKRVETHKEEEEFRYFSGRDISGTFSIDSDKITGSALKSMLKLKLTIEYEFADEVSKLDYYKQKDSLIARNRHRDEKMDFIEEKLIDGFDEYVLINFNEKQQLLVNRCLFVFFLVFVPVIELYKIYLHIRWADQTYSIKKVISTRFDLNQNEFAEKYSANAPKLLFRGEQILFENVHYKKEKIYDLPNEDEIKQAPALNQMYFKRLSSYNINLGKNYIQDQKPAPEYNQNPDFQQGPMQMQGYPNLNNNDIIRNPNMPIGVQCEMQPQHQLLNASPDPTVRNPNFNLDRSVNHSGLDSTCRELNKK